MGYGLGVLRIKRGKEEEKVYWEWVVLGLNRAFKCCNDRDFGWILL